MSRKSKKYEHAAHIKRHTEGTSNELSFDVLDAARGSLDGRTGLSGGGRRWLTRRSVPQVRLPFLKNPVNSARAGAGRGSGGAGGGRRARKANEPYSGARSGAVGPGVQMEASRATPGRIDSSREVERRKGRRRIRRRIRGALGVLAIAALGFAGWRLFGAYQAHGENVAELTRLMESVSCVDDALGEADGLLRAPLDADIEQWEQIVRALKEADETLEAVASRAGELGDAFAEGPDRTASLQTREAANARRALAEDVAALCEEASEGQRALGLGMAAWESVVAGDDALRDANALVENAETPQDMEEPQRLTEEARDRLESGKRELESLARTYEPIALDSELSFVNKKLEAVGFALSSADALIKRDREAAITQNDAYNKADREAVALAGALPDSVKDPVRTALDARTAGLIQRYHDHRAQAEAADIVIRDYLGAETK